MKTDILIVGGGPAGLLAGHSAKNVNKNLKILLVKNEKDIIIRCSEPYVIGGEVRLQKIIHSDEEMLKSKGIDVLVDEVTKIDYAGKTAYTKSKNKILFEKLILATGAEPFIPPIPGADLKGVFTLRNTEDTKNIKRISGVKKRAVIIGGGAIGIEVASLLRKKGLQVGIAEINPHLMPEAYDEEFGQKIEGILKKNGIKLLLGKKITAITGGNEATGILFGNKKLQTDFVILAAGVRSNTRLAKDCGCRIGKFGIEINEQCQTSLKNVYACGDCTQSLGFITNKPTPSQLATTAVLEGKVAGLTAAGKKARYPQVINPSVTVFFDCASGRVGLTERQAEEEGIKVVTGYGKAMNKYPSQKQAEFIENKLIFRKNSGTLIGAQIFGGKEGIDERIDLLALVIHKK